MSRHHFIPLKTRKEDIAKGCFRYETVRTCSHCHTDIHYYFSHWELAVKYNKAEPLKDELQRRKLITKPE